VFTYTGPAGSFIVSTCIMGFVAMMPPFHPKGHNLNLIYETLPS
jgi:hypothetical protein